MLGWQLLPALLLLKLFGFSFTTVRLSMWVIAAVNAFFLQRVMVRCGISESNAVLTTLMLVLSPLFLPLEVTYMTDISGVFAVVFCLYACLRALQTADDRSAAAWFSFASLACAILGMARQISWLGTLVMVPSALWLFRRRPRVLMFAVPSLLAGIAFIFLSMRWWGHQPYAVPESVLDSKLNKAALAHLCVSIGRAIEGFPLFLVPALLAFLVPLRASAPRVLRTVIAAWVTITALLTVVVLYRHSAAGLEPSLPNYVSVHGLMDGFSLLGERPIVLNAPARLVITSAVLLGVLAFLASIFVWRQRRSAPEAAGLPSLTKAQWLVLSVPFTLAYLALLLPRGASASLFDRYLMVPLIFAAIALVRFYQWMGRRPRTEVVSRTAVRLPLMTPLLILAVAIFSVMGTHDAFSLLQARVEAIAELRSAGVPADQIDGGFEYNAWTQIDTTGHLNDPKIRVPADAYRPVRLSSPNNLCRPQGESYFPDLHPRFGLSHDPKQCEGESEFAPITYHNWLSPHEARIYIVRYPAK